MARSLRIEFPGACCYVMGCSTRREAIFVGRRLAGMAGRKTAYAQRRQRQPKLRRLDTKIILMKLPANLQEWLNQSNDSRE